MSWGCGWDGDLGGIWVDYGVWTYEAEARVEGLREDGVRGVEN